MRNIDKWNFYVNGMQMHHSLCNSTCTPESMGFIKNLIPPNQYNKILDIGVGEGKETSILKDFGYSPTGIITGADNNRWAKENYPGIEFVDCDMHDLPFPNGSFDAIYMNQVFEHAYAPFIFLLECYSVLRNGGLAYICVPKFEERLSDNNPSTLDAQWISHHHPSVFPANVYRQLFEKTGFNVLIQNDNETSFLLEKGSKENLHQDLINLLSRRTY